MKIFQHTRLIGVQGWLQLVSTQIRNLQGQLQFALTLPDTPPEGPMTEERRIKNSDSSQSENDMRKAKRKHLSSKCQKSKTYVRDTVENRQPAEEDELFLYGGCDFDDQINRLVDTPHIGNAKN